jgi:hypothetical protein
LLLELDIRFRNMRNLSPTTGNEEVHCESSASDD